MIDIIHSYLVNIMHLIGYMVNTVCIHAYDYMINMTHLISRVHDQVSHCNTLAWLYGQLNTLAMININITQLHGYFINIIHLHILT